MLGLTVAVALDVGETVVDTDLLGDCDTVKGEKDTDGEVVGDTEADGDTDAATDGDTDDVASLVTETEASTEADTETEAETLVLSLGDCDSV